MDGMIARLIAEIAGKLSECDWIGLEGIDIGKATPDAVDEGSDRIAVIRAAVDIGAIDAWQPRLAISVYHRASDLWRIPQLVLEICPNYELYLRQHDGYYRNGAVPLPRSKSASKAG
jgi:hypothetical protein